MYRPGLRSRITRTYAAVIGFSGVEAGCTISEALLISWILGYSNIAYFGIWVRSSKIKLPVGQASPGNLLSVLRIAKFERAFASLGMPCSSQNLDPSILIIDKMITMS